MKIDFSKVVDLSHNMIPRQEPFDLKISVFDVDELGERGEPHSPGTWYVAGEVFMSTHCGTHVEFPLHHVEGGYDAMTFPLTSLIGEAVVLDFTNVKAGECMTLEQMLTYKDKIKEGDIVFLMTGLDKNWRTPDWEPYSYLECDALKWLVEEKKIKAIGTDATSIENFNIEDQPNHNYAFKHNLAMLESLTNLSKIENGRALVFILPLKIKGIEACPARVIAINDGGIL